jgi:hypothetical protein
MMKRPLALLLLLGLAACNRHGVADVTLDAAEAQRNATSAKTLADLQAAENASQGPAPVVHDARPAPAPKPQTAIPAPASPATPAEAAPEMPADDTVGADTNG